MVEVAGGSTVVLDLQFNGSKRELLLRPAVSRSEDDWRVLVFLRGQERVLFATHPNLVVLLNDLIFGAVLCGRDRKDEGIIWAKPYSSFHFFDEWIVLWEMAEWSIWGWVNEWKRAKAEI